MVSHETKLAILSQVFLVMCLLLWALLIFSLVMVGMHSWSKKWRPRIEARPWILRLSLGFFLVFGMLSILMNVTSPNVGAGSTGFGIGMLYTVFRKRNCLQ